METQTTLSAPQHITSLHSSCYVVTVDVSTWVGTKQDKAVSHEVTVQKNADAAAGKFTKMLMAGNATHKALINYRQTIYNWLQRCTYDWAGKSRLLPMLSLPKFRSEYDHHSAEFERLKTKLGDEYDSIVSDMAFKQGDLFNKADYPTREQVLSKFSMRLIVTDVPRGDFRNALFDDLADDLRMHYEKQTKAIVDAAMDKAASRLVTLAERIANACTEPTDTVAEDGSVKRGRRPKIVDATFEQAREMCSVLRDFNLTGNPDIEEARNKLEAALRNVSTDDLREYATTRKAVKDEMDDLLGKFGAFKRINREEESEDE